MILMDYAALILGLKRYGSTEGDICVHALGVTPEQIRESVVLAPSWTPDMMPAFSEAGPLTPPGRTIRVWDIPESAVTWITSGIGAPMLLDALLPLGLTPCRRVLFVGSVGSLDPGIGIGDLVIPEFSVCGDGASRYIASDSLSRDPFGEKVRPDARMQEVLLAETARVCEKYGVQWHVGRNFSIDTIIAQFAHIDTITGLGCNVIEMETAAAFRAAKLMGLPLAALFGVSDNTAANKSLVSGRTAAEKEYRKYTRRELFPQIIRGVFAGLSAG